MIRQATRTTRSYGAMAAMMPKLFLAYQFQIWFNVAMEIITLVITVAFWRAVFAGRATVGGLMAAQTLNYVMLARIFHDGAYATSMLREFGGMMREGGIQIALLRPLDFQASLYVQKLALLGLNVVMRFPLAFVAWLLFGLQLPADPVVWVAAAVSLLLGCTVMFGFDWILACAAFYTTDAWGLATARQGLVLFFSGMLLPLAIMPEWLRTIASILPFSQAVYLPVSILSGLTPLAELPRLWLLQLSYLVVLLVLSRLVFRRAVRVVTVQGG
jgi:ABC-2 type transport system permease protein